MKANRLGDFDGKVSVQDQLESRLRVSQPDQLFLRCCEAGAREIRVNLRVPLGDRLQKRGPAGIVKEVRGKHPGWSGSTFEVGDDLAVRRAIEHFFPEDAVVDLLAFIKQINDGGLEDNGVRFLKPHQRHGQI